MSSPSVRAAGHPLPSATGTYATAPNLSYADDQNVESYYTNAAASGSGSLAIRQDRRTPQSSPQYNTSRSQNDFVTYSDGTDQYDGSAPAPPPRSSSQQQRSSPHQPVAPSTAPLEARVAASRQARQNAERDYREVSQERPRDDTATAAASAARSRRKGPSSPDGPHRATSTRERSHQTTITNQSRSEATMKTTHPPAPLVREHSEVINRVVVSDPRVDAERMQDRIAEAQPSAMGDETGYSETTPQDTEGNAPGPARRQDYSKSSSTRRRDVQFGDYMLGQTLGEGEFGKVKLGWKKDGSTQVAIKLIRRDSVQSHPGRLPKIYREISILRDLAHPNIVRLHEMVETERHIGIILEYASGGELFDYILNHRYLKDPAARKLFAQLVSGVGYLHKKGIVHRDLKLENLLLDQNKNIIITDFGFANTFNPADNLSDEIEYNLSNKEFVRKFKLDRLDAKGMRRGDLMQTSCGSPCYAAPELVVSDSLYTGRKVDVWSCGVILYAMLAGYLPFDDDPANPEGDNINLLYKYITTTPLTFPEYVSPHARDLLRRILVPDPRKRADLFEVARHSWLSDYQHVVAHVGSTTNIADIANGTMPAVEPLPEPSTINRSASVRDAPKPAMQATPTLARTPEHVNEHDQQSGASRRDRGTRHTLQAEYVPPQSHTIRGQPPTSGAGYAHEKTSAAQPHSLDNKPLPQDPPQGQVAYAKAVERGQRMPPPARPGRDVPRSVSDSTGAFGVTTANQTTQQGTRPTTQGSITSGGPTRSDLRLPSRGSYSQPVAPTVATTNVEGRVTQPGKSARGYNISGPVPQHGQQASIGQPMTQQMPEPAPQQPQKGHHRRSSTLSNLSERLFGRSGSVRKRDEERQKTGRRYPPTSMKPVNLDGEPPAQPRMSTDSKRSFSFLGKKRSTDLDSQNEKTSGKQRFSLLPSSMSIRNMMGGTKDQGVNTDAPQMQEHQWPGSRPTTNSSHQPQQSVSNDGQYDGPRPVKYNNFSRPPQAQYRQQPAPAEQSQQQYDVYGGTGVYNPSQGRSQHTRGASQPMTQFTPQYPDGFNDGSRTSIQQGRHGRQVLTKPNRKFADAYDEEPGQYGGSSGAVKKVQDFFRRRGRARADSGYR